MKKVALLTLVFVGISFSGISQEKKEVKPERIKLYPSQHQSTIETPEQEITRLEQHLAALDEKEAWIKSNPEELKTATENDWFDQTEKTRKEIRTRLIELKK
jgi:hypothetical protein